MVGGPVNVTTAINTTWSSTLPTPCHDIDPNCQLCALGAQCGASAPAGTGPPSFYCNAFGVGCRDGRVANISLGFTGVVLSQLPSQVNQLSRLQALGELIAYEALGGQHKSVQMHPLRLCKGLRVPKRETDAGH